MLKVGPTAAMLDAMANFLLFFLVLFLNSCISDYLYREQEQVSLNQSTGEKNTHYY